MLNADVALQQRQEHGRRDVQRQGADHGAADDAADHRDEGQQWQRDQQGQHPWHHQQFHGVQPQGADGVDLLVGLHRADLRGERAGRAAGHEDGGQQHGEFTQERERDQVDGEDGRAEGREHGGAKESHHRAHQKGKQGHDGRGIQSGLLDMRDDRGEPPAMGLQGPAQQGFEDQPDEPEQLPGVLPEGTDGAAYALQEQQQDRALGFLDRYAVVLDRAIHVLQQGAAGLGDVAGAVRQTLGAEQFGQ
ncbi:hypothetical protein D3C81_863850 [compost metagenome]